ncbi:MAG: caspase family protein, partial [Alphaproteobacteria bacterium]|nr:caspase family protein [Alphaproteobacteria bacterium]
MDDVDPDIRTASGIRYAVALLFLFLVCLGAPPARASSDFALVIGIGQYKSTEIPQLHYAYADAKEMAAFLRDHSLFKRECIGLLLNSQATRDAIKNKLIELENRCSTSGPGGKVFIHFSGHAMRSDTSESADIKKASGSQAREFLIPFDGDPYDDYLTADGGKANDTYIKKEWFAARLSEIQASDVTVIIDACHSGIPDFAGLMKLYNSTSSVGAGKKIALMAASNIADVSFEFDELKHGALSWAVLNVLYAQKESTPKGNKAEIDSDALFGNVQSLFKTRAVSGKTLSFYHMPEIYYYPVSANSVVVGEVRGSGAIVKPTILSNLLFHPP